MTRLRRVCRCSRVPRRRLPPEWVPVGRAAATRAKPGRAAGWTACRRTVIALTQDRILTLHQGRQLKSLSWSAVVAVRKQDTMGNIRWYIVAQDEEYISVEGEIAQIDTLLETARRLAGLDPGPED